MYMQKVPIPPAESTQQCERVIAYIDGFNLYFGLKDSNFRRFYWLNLRRLCLELLSPHQGLMRTKYFTSRTWKPLDKYQRQSVFIEALETLEDFEIYYGTYQVSRTSAKRAITTRRFTPKK